MTLYSIIITLILVLDPLGNVPIFLSVLNKVDPKRRTAIVVREIFIALGILIGFLFGGQFILQSLNISAHALGIAGGIILFLISLKMIFPTETHPQATEGQEHYGEEPFIVPLAVPLIAGPSALTTVILLANQHPTWLVLLGLLIAFALAAITLLFANQLQKILGQKSLIAMERLMGMILTTVAVQMFLTGIDQYFNLGHSAGSLAAVQ